MTTNHIDADFIAAGRAYVQGLGKLDGKLATFAGFAKAKYTTYEACIEAETYVRATCITPFLKGIKALSTKLPSKKSEAYASKVAKMPEYATWWETTNHAKKNARATDSYTWVRMLTHAWPEDAKAAKAAKATTPDGIKKAAAKASKATSSKATIAAMRAGCAQYIKALQKMEGAPINITEAVAGFEAALLALAGPATIEATAKAKKVRPAKK